MVPGIIAKLRQLPGFRQAFDHDGTVLADLCQLSAFAATAADFAAATHKTVDVVARALQGDRAQST